MKHRFSTIVIVFDVGSLAPTEMAASLASWAAASSQLIEDGVVGQLPEGQVVIASPSQQVRLTIGPGRLELADYSEALPESSIAPSLALGVARLVSLAPKAVGFNHDFDIAVKGSSREAIQRWFIREPVSEMVRASGGAELGAAVRLLFKTEQGKWNIHFTNNDQKGTVRVGGNLEKGDVTLDADWLRAGWRESLDGMLHYLEQVGIAAG